MVIFSIFPTVLESPNPPLTCPDDSEPPLAPIRLPWMHQSKLSVARRTQPGAQASPHQEASAQDKNKEKPTHKETAGDARITRSMEAEGPPLSREEVETLPGRRSTMLKKV